MIEIHQQFWNEWAEAYRGFSETVEPYREAQRELAQSTVAALGEGVGREGLSVLDVGGGAGNMIAPLLDALAARRGSLKGVNYTLTDGSESMAALAHGRLEGLRRAYPEVKFQVLHTDTLGEGFLEKMGQGQADIVVSSWNIEYYPPEGRREIVTRLVCLVHPEGVLAYSSAVHLPAGLTIRDVLAPLGAAQVVHGLLTGGPGKMNVALTGLRQIARFGTAASASRFPEKPTLVGLQELGEEAGLGSVWGGYHLYGASAMVVGRKDAVALPERPKLPIAGILAGKEGYHGHPETVSFWSYLRRLLRGRGDGSRSD